MKREALFVLVFIKLAQKVMFHCNQIISIQGSFELKNQIQNPTKK